MFNLAFFSQLKDFKKIHKLLFRLFIFDIIMTSVYLIFCHDSDHWDLYGDKTDDDMVEKVLNRFYYSLNVSTTIGLGPIAPRSKVAMLLTILQIYGTILLLPFAG
jgi:hypothetical protein